MTGAGIILASWLAYIAVSDFIKAYEARTEVLKNKQ